MKSLSLAQLAVAILSFSSVTSALATPTADVADIVRRADESSTTPEKPTKTTTTKATLDTATTHQLNTAADTTSTSGTKGKTATDKTTDKTTGKGTKTSSKTTTSHATFDPVDPAGGVVMITPAATADMALFKIGEYATFKWNYTNVQATPTAVDVLAECSFASRTYTLTQNMTYATPGSFTWDTAAYQSSHIDAQLVTQEYTLIIYDADSGVSATAEAGYLGTFDGLTFGMYAPLSYTPLSEGWVCATCSGALSDTERRALGFALTMSVITVLSFTWFVTGMGVTM